MLEWTRHTDEHAGTPHDDDWYIVPSRRSYAQWDDETAVLVHVDPKTGDIRYPGRHDAKLKPGYERQYLRSLPEVNKFEKERGVVNHVMHYDGNGRAIDDYVGNERLTH